MSQEPAEVAEGVYGNILQEPAVEEAGGMGLGEISVNHFLTTRENSFDNKLLKIYGDSIKVWLSGKCQTFRQT